MATIIAITNQKGGVGKTTTAINLAAYLAKAGKDVLLIDLDPQGNTTGGLGIAKDALKHTLYDVLLGEVSAKRAALPTKIKRLKAISATPDLAGAEVELIKADERERKLKFALEAIAPDYDFILIDCPPSLGLLTVNALTAADFVLIPVQAEYYALEGLGQLIYTVKLIRERLNAGLRLLGIIVTMYDKRTVLSNQVVSELEKYFKDKLFREFVPRNIRLAEAPSHGKTILEYDRFSKGARSYKQLAKEVIRRVK